MNLYEIEGVNKLNVAENCFLQVLLSKFKLQRTPSNCVLNVEFNEMIETMTRRTTREKIRKAMPKFEEKIEEYQSPFVSLLTDRKIGLIDFDDSDFRFRFASGGTLPILTMKGRDYYCLFFRDVFPFGWNIANGGCDSLHELLDPSITICRELSEELIILGLLEGKDYLYRGANGKIYQRPEFEIARQLWNVVFPKKDFTSLQGHELDIDWIDGPDLLSVTFMSQKGIPLFTNPTSGCFVNVTVEDFSIEIDKIAKIPIEPDATILDGEISHNKILGRPIGLFEVEETNRKILNNELTFYPSQIYFFGNPRGGGKELLYEIVFKQYLPRLIAEGIREKKHLEDLSKIDRESNLFRLCPITDCMIRRYISYKEEVVEPRTAEPNVFISYSSKDEHFANRLFQSLTKKGLKCFMAPDSFKPGGDILQGIFDAIQRTDKLIVVLSKNSIGSRWVETEVNEAFRIEREKGKRLIIPLSIDHAVFETEKAFARRLLDEYIPNLEKWRNDSLFKKEIGKLYKAIVT